MKVSGNIYVMLFVAVGMAGIVGVSVQQYLMSPLKSANVITKKNSAETQMQLGIRIAATNAVTQQATGGDCDNDGMVEPLPYVDAGAGAHPSGGGYLPANTGGVRLDPWNTQYGYCVWDHGSAIDDAGCGGAPQLRLPGTSAEKWEAMAVISAGPDKTFQTSCNAWADLNADNAPDTPLINKPVGSDDVYYAWTYEQATTATGSLWSLNIAMDTAGIARRIAVRDGSNNEQLSFDPVSKELAVGSTGRGDFPNLDVDYIQSLTGPSVQLLRGLAFFPEDTTGTTFTFRNLTGDSLQLWNGSYSMVTFDPSGTTRFQPTSDATKYAELMEISSLQTPVFRIYGSGTGDNSASIRLYNRSGGVNTNRYAYISAGHTADNAAKETTSTIVLGPQTAGANPADVSSFISFATRPTGAAVGATPVERMRINANGDVGIGTVSPQGRLHVVGNMSVPTMSVKQTDTGVAVISQGAARVGDSGAACDYAMLGGIHYNSVTGMHEFCDGANWIPASYTTCGTLLPATFSFTEVTSAATNTVITSDIRQISGIGACSIPVRLTGATGAQYRVCSSGVACDSTVVYDWSSNVNFVTDGQYVQIRYTTPLQSNYKSDITMIAGERSYNWSVKTSGSCSDPNPSPGTFCSDGTVFVGFTPDGNTKMYTTKCHWGQYYDGSTCVGTRHLVAWSRGATISTGVTNAITGETNTNTLALLANADAPYPAAAYCYNLNENGQTDWYLPSSYELRLIHTMCSAIMGMTCTSSTGVWSSTDVNASTAAYYRMNEGTARAGTKTSGLVIRCVRKD